MYILELRDGIEWLGEGSREYGWSLGEERVIVEGSRHRGSCLFGLPDLECLRGGSSPSL